VQSSGWALLMMMLPTTINRHGGVKNKASFSGGKNADEDLRVAIEVAMKSSTSEL